MRAATAPVCEFRGWYIVGGVNFAWLKVKIARWANRFWARIPLLHRRPIAWWVNRFWVSLPLPVSTLFRKPYPGNYSKAVGYTNAKFSQSTEAAIHVYSQIFSILDKANLKYAVFAGTAVGLVRNGEIMPWMDDIDIIIFEEDVPFFEEHVVALLRECGFRCSVQRAFPGGGMDIKALEKRWGGDRTIQYAVGVDVRVPLAHIDVFYSKYENGVLRNLGGWGQYDKKQIPKGLVEPFQSRSISDLEVPFFANVEDYVASDYGDVTARVVVRTHNRVFYDSKFLANSKKDVWNRFHGKFQRIAALNGSPIPPGVSLPQARAKPNPLASELRINPGVNFASICREVAEDEPSQIVITDSDHIFWVMDLKYLFPHLEIAVELSDLEAVPVVVHLRHFVDRVSAVDPGLHNHYVAMHKRMLGAI